MKNMVITRTIYGSRPKNLVQTIERMSSIFDALGQNSQGMSVKNLSEKVNLPMGTTHRLLTSLAYFGFVTQDLVSKQYHLGFKLVDLGNALLDQIDLRTVARPYLLNLTQKANEAVHLVVLDQKEALYLDRVETDENRRGLQMASKVGMRVSAHSSGVGKVLLAAFSEKELNDFIKAKGLPRRTEKTITTADQLKSHLEMVRNQGYAIDDEEDHLGTRCVAAPIRNELGHVIAAISISGPTIRITRKKVLDTFKDQVMDAALEISRQLGFQEDKDHETKNR
jgi:IclR family transcriptional regulator, KDG regulon repressor